MILMPGALYRLFRSLGWTAYLIVVLLILTAVAFLLAPAA
jgi:hypothetical protein